MLALLTVAAAWLFAGEKCVTGMSPLAAGDCFARQQRWEEAEAQYRIYLAENPNMDTAIVRHARSLAGLGQPIEAVLELEELIRKRPDSAAALKELAGLLERLKDHGQAEQMLLQCAKSHPADTEAWRLLAGHYAATGAPSEAIRYYRQALKGSPADPLLLASLAAAQGSAGQPEAAAIFVTAIAINGKSRKPDPAVHLIYGEFLLGRDKVDEALAAFTKALTLDWHSGRAYYLRAAANEKRNDLPRAEADALAAVRESPGEIDFHRLLSRILQTRGKVEKAVLEAASVAQLNLRDEEFAQAWALRKSLRAAEPLFRDGRFLDALPHYEEAVKRSPEAAEAWFALGICYSQTGRAPDAEAAIRRHLSIQPGSADGHAALGLMLLRQNRTVDARHELEQAIRLDPAAVEPRKALAHIFLATADFAAAAEVLRPVAVLRDADSQALLMLAEALLRGGDKAGAALQVDRVLAADPANPTALQLKQSIGQ